MGQSVRQNVALRMDKADFTGVNGDCSESNKSPKTVIYYRLLFMIAAIKGLSSGAKCLFAKLDFDAYGRKYCRTGVGLLANSLGAERETIRVWLAELDQWGLIKFVHERRRCCYYLAAKYRIGDSIPLLAETMKRRDVGATYKIEMCWLSYQQAKNDCSWPKQKNDAEVLGVSTRTIRRTIKAMKAKGEVQIWLRRLNRKYGNKYILTLGAVHGGRIFGENPHRTTSAHLNKNMKAKSSLSAMRAKSLAGYLSASGTVAGFGPEAVASELLGCGIHAKVARPMAFEQKHPYESVVQAINNAQILRATLWRQAQKRGMQRPYFTIPGYVVNALNRARREGKTVGTTKIFRGAGDMTRKRKLAKAAAAIHKPMSQRAFERRRRELIRSLGLTA
ncbi:hypothetical protein ES705_15677 [subsurface metagenome]